MPRGTLYSVHEAKALKLAQADAFIAFTSSTLCRVHPNSVRIDSSNMNPQEFWNFGLQMVALNYQTPGLMMDLQVRLDGDMPLDTYAGRQVCGERR
jgi:hypothetical protein